MNYFRLSFFFLVFIAFISTSVSAQIVQKYGDNNGAINSNSVLELESSNKGLLLPRLALTSTTAVTPLSAHVQGMTVYNTATAGDVTPGIYTNSGAAWVRVTDSAILSSYLPLTGGSISGQLRSTVVTGTAPFAVDSTTPVTNLSIGGNAATATTATNATNTGITNDTTTAVAVYPTFVTSNTGNLPQKVTSTKLSFIPSTGILSATGFSGSGASLTGTASALSIGGNAATATTATNATNTGITSDITTAATFYPTFVSGISGNLPQKVASTDKLSFIPSTGILTATGFSGSGAELTGISASNITTGVLPVDNGGTGVTSIAGIQTILGLAGSNVAIGASSGVTTQGTNAIAIGEGSGNFNQGSSSVAIGPYAGYENQGATSVAIGSNAAQSGSGASSIAIGFAAGQGGSGDDSIAIGSYASSYGANSLAIGASATSGTYTNSAAIGNGAESTGNNTIQLGNTAVTNVSTSGTITAGAVTYPNTHGTADQVLSTTGSGTLAWTDVSKNITSSEVALNTKINGVQLYAIQGSFTATGTSTAVSVTPPSNMSGYYSMTTYKDGKTFRKEIFSFNASTSTNNVITGTGPYTEIYPAGTYYYVLEYFK
jgi:hypothetical protein